MFAAVVVNILRFGEMVCKTRDLKLEARFAINIFSRNNVDVINASVTALLSFF